MADLETKYGEDAAQALYMWRFAGVSFGLEAQDQDVAELMALIQRMEIIERSSSDPESQAAADRRLERIEKAIKKLNGLDARRDTLEAAVEAADRAEEIARDLEYEIVSSAPDGEQLADDYEELGGGRCAVM